MQREQQHQKIEKRQRTRTMVIKNDYSGTIFPLHLGCIICIKQPISDEPRLELKKGDIVKVTRIKRYTFNLYTYENNYLLLDYFFQSLAIWT